MNNFPLLLAVFLALRHYFINSVVNGLMQEISIDSFEPEPGFDTSYITVGSVRVSRKSRNRFAISGEFELYQNLGNENEVMYSVRGNSGKGAIIVAGKSTFCKFLNMKHPIADAFRSASNLPPVGTCPLERAKYTIKNFEIKEHDLPPTMMSDQYVFVGRMTNNEGKQIIAYQVKFSVK
ncbi:uncharacterized protein LOC131427689 [Malaya genurostris]|uniref:uncharacterized protein LOC131427689 n=1 Tax=Malaya genurostris TaxID=325434 RepID=UPI0026F3E567|nr:uncharacterized protein LOC131427689 [Malaya genurostris]